MKRVVVYTTNFCPYCVRAKQLLKQRGIEFDEIQFDMDDDAKWDELQKRSGIQTVPQIFFDGRILGGYNELKELDARDQLQSLKG